MPGLKEAWVTYAGDEGEAWKCILLARSLRKSLSSRQLLVFVSEEDVSREMGRRLQSEVGQCFWLNPKTDFPKRDSSSSSSSLTKFSSLAKLWALRKVSHPVFLSPNTLILSNMDSLFHLSGSQLVNGGKEAAFLVLSRSLGQGEKGAVVDWVCQTEEEGANNALDLLLLNNNATKNFDPDMTLALEIDMGDPHPLPLPSKGGPLKMVCFSNGHPFQENNTGNQYLAKRGLLGSALIRLCASLCPEASLNGVCPKEDAWIPLPEELASSIAVVGMSCRYPCANNLTEFWSLLAEGREGIRKVPEGRWTKDQAFIRMDDLRSTQAGFLSVPIHTFDAKFFSTNLADMAYLDPQQRLSLRLVWEGLEHAGIDPNSLKNSLTGVFGGWWRNDWKEMLQMQSVVEADFIRGYMGNGLGPLTARISHFFELIGPAYSTESGCSTSIAGVDMAISSLREEACDLAIAVGANLLLHPFKTDMMEGVLAPDGRCKTFDAKGDGFGRAEGVGVLILKRLSNAVADGDRIWGLIRGSAVVQEGTSRSMGTPTVDVEAEAMRLALERAGVDPGDVDFLETHGTGTAVGDPVEVAAVNKAFGSSRRLKPLVIGSVKTNIGHTESVCGIAGIQKTLLAMAHETIPKHLNISEGSINPNIDLSAIPAVIPFQSMEWKKRDDGGKPRIAGVNSFGITGAQAHVVLQEPPKTSSDSLEMQVEGKRGLKLLTFSAKTEEALRVQRDAYVKLLKKGDCPSLSDLEYTMHTGRPHLLPYRQFAIGATSSDLVSSIEELGKSKPLKTSSTTPKVCFLFTGQGSQYPGMAASLYASSPIFQSTLDWLSSVIEAEHGFSVKESLFSPKHAYLLSTTTLHAQTAIFVVEVGLLRLWESLGVTPDAVLGHSLGEFTAAVAAGVLSVQEALNLVIARAKLVDALPSGVGAMCAVGADLETVRNWMTESEVWLDVAAVNSGTQTVVAGEIEMVKEFKAFCEGKKKAKTTLLDASHAFHSRLLDPILEAYGKVVGTIEANKMKPKIPYISGVEGRVLRSASEFGGDYWRRHTREKVQWTEACRTAVIQEGFRVFLEIGPHPVLSALLASNAEDEDVSTLPSLRRSRDEWDVVLTSLGKLSSLGLQSIDWGGLHRFEGPKAVVDLPSYHFEESPFWMKIKDDGSVPFHPLVGSKLPNASSVSIYTNSLVVGRLPFLRDHALGDKIIFPCAGYVEMCLAAGYASSLEEGFVKPTSPLCVRGFSIHTPICLAEGIPTEFQVVVEREGGDFSASIFTKLTLEETNTFKWVKNATGTFSASPPALPTPLPPFAEVQERCSILESESFDYDLLKKWGFNFGPSCQSLKGGYSNGGKKTEWLVPFQTKETQEDLDRFIIHPWATDPMLQAQIIALGMLAGEERTKRLIVPIAIENFTWWGQSSGSGWVYIRPNEAHLFSNEGTLLVSMLGTEFMDTTIGNILSLIEAQKNPYPSLAEYAWKERLGGGERRVPEDARGSIDLGIFTQEPAFKSVNDQANNFTAHEEEFHQAFHRLGGLFLKKMAGELGNLEGTWEEVVEKAGVLPNLGKFMRYLLLELVDEGWLSLRGDKFVRRGKEASSSSALDDQVAKLVASLRTSHPERMVEVDAVLPVWAALGDILTGKTSALPLLFAEGDFSVKGAAEVYYTQSLLADKQVLAFSSVSHEVLERLSKMGSSKTVVRVLEVGAGVGSATTHLISSMKAIGPPHFDYTYTDISPAFLKRGEALFEDAGMGGNLHLSLLDVEKDPLAQGYVPESYDVIVAIWVLHATKDLQESVRNLAKLLKPGGYLIVAELVVPYRAINLLYGGLEGFWRFEDSQLRPWKCELGTQGWEALLEERGFGVVASLPNYKGHTALIVAKKTRSVQETASEENRWIILGSHHDEVTQRLRAKLERANSTVVVLTKETFEAELKAHLDAKPSGILYLWGLDAASSEEACAPFLTIAQALLASLKTATNPVKVVVVTQGQLCTGPTDQSLNEPQSSPLIGMLNALCNEGMGVAQCRAVDVDPRAPKDSQVQDAFAELFIPDGEVLVAYRSGQRATVRVRPYKAKSNPLPLPSSPRWKLLLPPSHLIQDLVFVPAEGEEALGDDEVEIEVKAYALNFLDVLMVTKPDPVFEAYNYLGVDIAGVVSKAGSKCLKKVGDRIVVIRRSGAALPTHLVSKDNRTVLIPDDLTFEDASTYPMGILTVATCLLKVAKAQKGDVVLVHTASGGVGLIAIQLAKSLGCTIVVTAGNERKRNYLRGLGLSHVFNSRTPEYGERIRAALGGRGVDVVLNSLTSPGFKEATLSLCEKGARFVEMSKMNIWSKEEVRDLRPDVDYQVVDISTLPEPEFKWLLDYLGEQLSLPIGERPAPLPYTRFDAAEIRDALEHLEKVKHVGKIVLRMPEGKNFPLFNDLSTYLITGGLGGIALEVAKWMASSGAKNLLLVGRSEPKADALEKIRDLRAKGVRVEVRQLDVSDMHAVKALVKNGVDLGEGLPPLRGIMHAAGILLDGMYENQTWAMYQAAFGPKVAGAWNLHQVSKDFLLPLEHFVLFSSLTSTLGAVGQSNYVAANQFLDSLVHYRTSLGLPATGINWGQWGQVGLAANMVVVFNKPLTPLQGVAALEHALKAHKTQIMAHEADLRQVTKILPSTTTLLSDIGTSEGGVSSGEVDGDAFWAEYDGSSDKIEVVRKFLKRLIRITLKMDRGEEVEDEVTFADMGMDSLMMVEMKNGLQASVGKRVKISINAVKDCKNVAQLAARLVALIEGEQEQDTEGSLTPEELLNLVRKDAELPKEIETQEGVNLPRISEVSTVLVTGVTGMLGPYVLRDLLKRKNITKVVCLLRPSPVEKGSERLKRVLEKKGLYSSMSKDFGRIECVSGDVTTPLFGLTEEVYLNLASRVGAVIHLAVKALFDGGEVYKESGDQGTCRVQNLRGIKEVLAFAVAGGTLKHVLHASSFVAVTEMDGNGNVLSEDWPKVEEVSRYPKSAAYAISKLACDLLAKKAVERGIPVKVFRLPQLGGEAGVGANAQMDSFLMLRLLGQLYIRSMPEGQIPLSLMAVDQAGRLTVDLFFRDEATPGMYNLLNPHLGNERNFETLAMDIFGVQMEVLPPEEFATKWNNSDSEDDFVSLVKVVTSHAQELMSLQEMPYVVSWREEGNARIFWSRKVQGLLEGYPGVITPSWDVLKADLLHAKKVGVLDRYKIKMKK